VGSHGYFLQLQDEDNRQQTDQVAEALQNRDLDAAPITAAERKLLQFVKVLTEHAYRATDGEVENLRQAGWSDPQIAEAVYVAGMFAFFNRVADAFGLADPNYEQILRDAGGPARFPTEP
jgi:alkylhydroperoxidase family enzyme